MLAWNKRNLKLAALACIAMNLSFTGLAHAKASDNTNTIIEELQPQGTIFPIGTYNERNKHNFTGDSYVARLAGDKGINIANVTFVDGAHTHWHIHNGTCQIIMPVSGKGYYQIWGQAPQKLKLGETISIPDGVKHWHGAAPNSTFQHVVVTGPDKYTTTWLEEVDSKIFNELK